MKITNTNLLSIEFLRGGKIKFPIKYLRNINIEGNFEGNVDNNNNNNYNEKDLTVLQVLDEIADKEIKAGRNIYFRFGNQYVNNVEIFYMTEEDLQLIYAEESGFDISKIIRASKDEEYAFSYIDTELYISDIQSGKISQDDYDAITIFNSPYVKFLIINQEQLDYYFSKFIRYSAKEFIISSNAFGYFDFLNNGEITEISKNFKFYIQDNKYNFILNDIDLSYYNSCNDDIFVVFDENENGMIFKPFRISGNYPHIAFRRDDEFENPSYKSININGKNYKYLDVQLQE